MGRRLFAIMRPAAFDYARDIFVRAFVEVAKDLGFDAKIVGWVDERRRPLRYSYSGAPKENDQRDDDVWVSFDLVTTPPYPLKRGVVIYYNMEPLPLPEWVCGKGPAARFERFYRDKMCRFMKGRDDRGSIDVVFDYCEQTTRYLNEIGDRAFFCPPGYHESMETGDGVKPLEEGVWYLGRPSDHRRGKITEECGGTVIYCRGSGGRLRKRDRLTVTPGVHLNVHRFEMQMTFGALRVIGLLLANKRFVLSEPVWWSPLVSFDHWVEVPTRHLARWARYYMEHTDERDEIAENGYRFCRKSLHLKDWVQRAMSLAGLI